LQQAPVDLWTIPLTDPRPLILSAEEAARAARFRFEDDRVRWTRARSAMRMVLAEYVDRRPDALEFNYSANGKPSLPDDEIEFNLSHAGDFAMVAVTKSVPVGVDIERIREGLDIANLLRRLSETDLPETIPELYARWTLREAKTKAVGGQLMMPTSDGIAAIPVSAPEGYVASVALVGFQPLVSRRA
jgi:4'-phosphopantetheinyl transferase